MFFRKKIPVAPLHVHDWKTVAIDSGFHTTYEDKDARPLAHVITYKVCKDCEDRSFDVTGLDLRYGSPHKGVAKQTDLWMAGAVKSLYFTEDAEFFDPMYVPKFGIEAAMQQFKNDPAFSEMIKNHKLVEDAVGQLEVALKLSQGL